MDTTLDEECPICFRKKKNFPEILCSHKICALCLSKWFKNNSTCPVCRKLLDTRRILHPPGDDKEKQRTPRRAYLESLSKIKNLCNSEQI